ncbi:uncharacterized protein LOC113646048 isoform X1 [Tachysurus fulvidraco]|uniref:uncharacterized protein LOC113646048 isoform X1 n=1 Tax=Tachysurus fulvidraco TaxID=1234273 RepID=UPI000F507BBE|nr:uncharacterized protein LOC113646048 isoform X1 [Tachysurus fulvidraco]
MSALWSLILTLYLISSAQFLDFSGISFLTVKFGENVSLNCPFLKASSIDRVVWFKQMFGAMPQKVGERSAYKEIKISPEFEKSGFVIKTNGDVVSLTIPRMKTEYGGLYFCGILSWENFTLSNGTFLAVTDDRDVKVSVWQRGVSDSVPAGASVTLQCSVLSESRAAELQVLWFRAAPPQSHPQIIYTHHNSSHQCEIDSSTHTCVYNFSKNILSLSDTGTYYCAVLLCGKIIFGNGTRIQMQNVAASYNPVVICQGTALVMCGILISVQTVLLCKRKNGPQHRERIQHDAVINTDETNTQDSDTVELNYAALHFKEKKSKRARENRVRVQNSVYSELQSSITT